MCTQSVPNLFYCYLDGCDLIMIRRLQKCSTDLSGCNMPSKPDKQVQNITDRSVVSRLFVCNECFWLCAYIMCYTIFEHDATLEHNTWGSAKRPRYGGSDNTFSCAHLKRRGVFLSSSDERMFPHETTSCRSFRVFVTAPHHLCL